MTFSIKLKNNNLDLWNKTHVNHYFISGIRDGTLEFDKFKHYMIQEGMLYLKKDLGEYTILIIKFWD